MTKLHCYIFNNSEIWMERSIVDIISHLFLQVRWQLVGLCQLPFQHIPKLCVYLLFLLLLFLKCINYGLLRNIPNQSVAAQRHKRVTVTQQVLGSISLLWYRGQARRWVPPFYTQCLQPQFGGKSGAECLATGLLLPILLQVEYSVKLK